jgi:isopenicillin N synthase-like dioxygenase
MIPTIDISKWMAGSKAERDSIAGAVDVGCRSVGFLQLVGHAIEPGAIEGLLAATDALFARPLAEKLSWVPASPEVNRGYAAKGTEGLSYSIGQQSVPDLFEAFNVGLDDVPQLAEYQRRRHDLFAENIWPQVPNVRAQINNYFEAARLQAMQLTQIFAYALDLEPHFFAERTTHSTDTLRINHYLREAGEPEPVEGQMRMGAHTDYGIVTVLYADSVPGLEILGPDGAWHGVVPTPGALLVNLGDLLAEWTNDRWRSTLHRVVPPPRDAGPVRRRSAAFFHDGNHDALVECLPTCVSEDNPAKYPPVLAGDHLMAKLLGPRTLTESAVTVNTAADRMNNPQQPCWAATRTTRQLGGSQPRRHRSAKSGPQTIL